jgi:monoamine oxidase
VAERERDVVIVGAGLSGLAAATSLAKAGLDVVVLEAAPRVGGRLLARELGGARFDVGGQWIGDGHERLTALVRRLGLTTFPTHHEGDKLLSISGELRRYPGTIPKLSPLELVQLQAAITFIDRASAGIGADPWRARRAATLDALTVGAVERLLRGAGLGASFRAAVRTVFGADPGELSLLHLLYYAKTNGGFMKLVEVKRGAQETRIAEGAGSVPEALARELGDRVHLEAPVRAIDWREDGVRVTSGRGVFPARHVVVAVPPSLVARIDFTPALPYEKRELVRRFPMGATTKVLATYDAPFWRDAGLSGEALFDDEPLALTFDNTHPDGPACLVGFIVGTPARAHAAFGAEEKKARVLAQLGRVFGARAREPRAYVEKDWTEEPWIGGCPVASPLPGVLTTYGAALRASVGAVHFAGTETAREWGGYMEGAIEAGERAAGEVLARE